MTSHPNPRHDGRFLKYQQLLLSKVDTKIQKGLEIGAFDLPFVTPDTGIVEFADHLSTSELKEKAAQTPGHSPDFVVAVDHVLTCTPLRSLASDYEWIAAAHVVEHAPNLIGWFKAIGDRLSPNGLLFCVVPDSRYTFDLNRPLSSLGKIIQDHLDDRATPSFRDVFDAFYYFRPVSSSEVWQGDITSNARFHNDFNWAWGEAAKTNHSHVDAHCNTFIPASFEEIIVALSGRGLIPFELEEISETEPGGIDFYAVLRKKRFQLDQHTEHGFIGLAENSSLSYFDAHGVKLKEYASTEVSRLDTPAAFRKFERRAPSSQNAVDIFEGKWACDFSEICPGLRSGEHPLFTLDPRPLDAARVLGINGRLDGMRVLELGPLEGAHTYQLEKLGAASILAIEANAEAFLKCLITKEILCLGVAKFVYGDFYEYLNETNEEYDLVFCCGVLYHMSDPIALIESIAKVTDRCFIWTHYYDSAHYRGTARQICSDPQYSSIKFYVAKYDNMDYGRFWGGNRSASVWLDRDDIISTFRRVGFNRINVITEDVDHPNGACLSFAAQR
jgi:2-polyprenyl-3-methyl-5-hydroxy-6-metoxy-1,4-benzoquinol methylase